VEHSPQRGLEHGHWCKLFIAPLAPDVSSISTMRAVGSAAAFRAPAHVIPVRRSDTLTGFRTTAVYIVANAS